ncbi:hypothetical protein RIF29_23038 [Crotalaria pallida]|uniref:Peptidase A1 domain-containing protein n=1 Tax=Crotalaria pallida TaxID=3830 RepID=A0AAN9F568_CROPI
MASNIPMMSIVFVLLVSLCSVYSSNSSPSHSPAGFTLELIPPYSPKSPLFIPNLTSEERMQMMFQHSHERAKYLDAMLSSTSSNHSKYSLEEDTVTPITIKRVRQSAIVVEVGIGTFGNNNDNDAYKSYLLTMDTGSGTIWTQCESCKQPPPNHCYPQTTPYFPNSESKTYKEIKPNKPYTISYAGEGTNSSGILATETFTFSSASSSTSKPKKLANIVFGCGLKNYNKNAEAEKAKGNTYPIAGVFGMGLSLEKEDHSFIKQVEDKIGGRFSYCFVPKPIDDHITPPPMYLKFGSDIKEPRTRSFPIIPLFTKQGYGSYFVKLEGLGVNDQRLNIDSSVFSPSSTGPGGLLLDTGSEISYIVKAAFDVLTKKMDSYFENFERLVTKEGGVCYRRMDSNKGFTNIPSLTFYFEGGAKLDVIPQGTFFYSPKQSPASKETFCLAILPKPYSLLGAFQQVNHRFIYNTKSKMLRFGRVDCAKDG